MEASIVLVHGAAGNAATFAPVLDRFLDRFGEASAIDLPGRGSSPGPALDRAERAAAWLLEELSRRRIARPLLVGHSYGGAVALSAALASSTDVAGVALVASGARLRVAPAILERAARLETLPLDFAFGPETPAEVIRAYAAAAEGTPPATALADWQACDHFDVIGSLERVTVPALVMYGEQDELTPPKHQLRLAEALGAEAIAFAGRGHMLPWEDPDAVAAAVRRFVEKLGRGHR